MASRIVPSFRPPGWPAAKVPPPQPFPYEPPVNLFASVTVQSGAEAGIQARALSNLTGKPVEIHELRFSVSATHAGAHGASSLQRLHLGSIVEVKIDLDGKPITNGFVPVWLLGRVDNYWSEQITGQPWVGNTATLAQAYSTWRLAVPLPLRPGAVVSATVRHRGAVPDPVTVDVSLAGKQVAALRAGPRRIPYAAAFLAAPLGWDVAGSEESPEHALWNSTLTPLRVERLTGRIALLAATKTGYASSDDWVADFFSTLLSLRLNTSTGAGIVRNPLPFGAVFSPAGGHTLEVPFIMRPGEYLIARLDKRARRGSVPASLNGTYSIQPQIGLVGWREE